MILSQAPVSGFETVSFLEPPFFGMKSYQNTAGLLQGVPQQTISNPFPSSVNPLIAPNGKAAGTAVGRGGTALLRYPQNTQKARNDRFNVNFQRQLPGQIVAFVHLVLQRRKPALYLCAEQPRSAHRRCPAERDQHYGRQSRSTTT